jgi:predicted small secreted protein
MKKSMILLTLTAALLAFGMVLAGCPTESDNGGGVRDSIVYTDVAIQGEGASAVTIAEKHWDGFMTFSVTADKMTYKFGTPE